MAAPSPPVDIESEVFALRLANLLRSTRLEQGRSLRAVAKASGGRYTRDEMRQFEEGGTGLGEDVVEDLSELYGADLGTILPSRLPVAITGGVISSGGVTATFVAMNGTSLLTAYLRLIRSMRCQKKAPMIVLRRDDIEVIAAYLDEPGETVVDRLTALMDATLTQRTAIAMMFATGAIVIGLAGSTAARSPEPGAIAGPRLDDRTVGVVADVPAPLDDAVVALGDVAQVLAVGADGAAPASDHVVESPTTVVTADAAAVGQDITDPSTSSSASLSSGGAALSDADAKVADVLSTDASPVPAATPDATVVESGSVVIPELPYGDAVVIDDGLHPWMSADPWGSDDSTDASSTDVPPVVVDTPATVPPVVSTDTPPPPPSVDAAIVGEVPVVDEIPAAEVTTVEWSAAEAPVSEAPVSETPVVEEPAAETSEVEATSVGTRVERRAAAKRAKHDLKAADKVAARVSRIDAKANAAIQRATNKISIEADEERFAALKVISARADIAIDRASMRIYVNGGGPKPDATMASVNQEVHAKADADKEAVLDRIDARAGAEKAGVVAVIEAKAAAARAALGHL